MIRCFNSLHPLYHVFVLGSMCSFIHVFLSYGRMSCAYLIYLCILHAFHLMVLFMAPILLFSIFLCHEFNIYRYTPRLLFKTMCIVTRNSKTCMHNLRGSLSYML